jgi:ketosteroid isomerase-like protein
MPTVDEFSSWLERYRQAFIAFDAEAAAELFSDNATYQDSPYADAVVGRAAIAAYWRMVAELMSEVDLEFEVVVVSGDVGVAHLRDALTRRSSGARARYDGIFVVRFDRDGRSVDFREWWVQEPPRS